MRVLVLLCALTAACGTTVVTSGGPDGAVVVPDGAVLLPDGAVLLPDGAVLPLPSGCRGTQIRCVGRCVDARLDPVHCGACNNACARGLLCLEGVCSTPIACNAPRSWCGGRCVDTTLDRAHCGGCNRACATSDTCVSGRCRGPSSFFYNAVLDNDAEVSRVRACDRAGAMHVLAHVDDDSTSVPLAFPFTFWGTLLEPGAPVNVSSNGFISLDGLRASPTSGGIPLEGAPNGVIAAYWTDIVTTETGVCMAVVDAAPVRRFAIEWRDAVYFGNRMVRVSVEMVLHENGGVIEFLYPSLMASTALRTATVGIESLDGRDGLSLCSNPTGAGCPRSSGQRITLHPSR